MELIREHSNIPIHIWKLDLWQRRHGRSTTEKLTAQSVVLREMFIHIEGKNEIKIPKSNTYANINSMLNKEGLNAKKENPFFFKTVTSRSERISYTNTKDTNNKGKE